MTPAALATALEEEARGEYRSETWAGCTRPDSPCGAAPVLQAGCASGPCVAGEWPITCRAPDGSVQTCRFDGAMELAAGAKAACGAGGGIQISFGAP